MRPLKTTPGLPKIAASMSENRKENSAQFAPLLKYALEVFRGLEMAGRSGGAAELGDGGGQRADVLRLASAVQLQQLRRPWFVGMHKGMGHSTQ